MLSPGAGDTALSPTLLLSPSSTVDSGEDGASSAMERRGSAGGCLNGCCNGSAQSTWLTASMGMHDEQQESTREQI